MKTRTRRAQKHRNLREVIRANIRRAESKELLHKLSFQIQATYRIDGLEHQEIDY